MKSSPIEPPAGFKKETAKKAGASSFPSMEDQLKDLLKGNSEESLVAPGHNSTRFHLDYTNAGMYGGLFGLISCFSYVCHVSKTV